MKPWWTCKGFFHHNQKSTRSSTIISSRDEKKPLDGISSQKSISQHFLTPVQFPFLMLIFWCLFSVFFTLYSNVYPSENSQAMFHFQTWKNLQPLQFSNCPISKRPLNLWTFNEFWVTNGSQKAAKMLISIFFGGSSGIRSREFSHACQNRRLRMLLLDR